MSVWQILKTIIIGLLFSLGFYAFDYVLNFSLNIGLSNFWFVLLWGQSMSWIYFLFSFKWKKMPEFTIPKEEQLIEKSKAKYALGIFEGDEGILALTDKAFYFDSFKPTSSHFTLRIELDKIQQVECIQSVKWTEKKLKVVLSDGTKHQFALKNAQQ